MTMPPQVTQSSGCNDIALWWQTLQVRLVTTFSFVSQQVGKVLFMSFIMAQDYSSLLLGSCHGTYSQFTLFSLGKQFNNC